MFCEWRGAKDDGCKFKKTGVKLELIVLYGMVIWDFYSNGVIRS